VFYLLCKAQKKVKRLSEANDAIMQANNAMQEEPEIDRELKIKICFYRSVLCAKFGYFS